MHDDNCSRCSHRRVDLLCTKTVGQALFTQAFKSITADDSSEFSSLDDTLKHLSDIYFAHPYSFGKVGQTNGIMGCSDDLLQE